MFLQHMYDSVAECLPEVCTGDSNDGEAFEQIKYLPPGSVHELWKHYLASAGVESMSPNR